MESQNILQTLIDAGQLSPNRIINVLSIALPNGITKTVEPKESVASLAANGILDRLGATAIEASQSHIKMAMDYNASQGIMLITFATLTDKDVAEIEARIAKQDS